MGGTVFQKPYAHLHINRIRFYSFSKNEPTRISHTHTHAKKRIRCSLPLMTSMIFRNKRLRCEIGAETQSVSVYFYSAHKAE